MKISSELTQCYGQLGNKILFVCLFFTLLPAKETELGSWLQAELSGSSFRVSCLTSALLVASSPLGGGTSSSTEGSTSTLPHCNSR